MVRIFQTFLEIKKNKKKIKNEFRKVQNMRSSLLLFYLFILFTFLEKKK